VAHKPLGELAARVTAIAKTHRSRCCSGHARPPAR
jgi:hypothetical protein